MQQLSAAIKNMIDVSEQELQNFLSRCVEKKFKRHEILSNPGIVPRYIWVAWKKRTTKKLNICYRFEGSLTPSFASSNHLDQ